MCIILPQAKPEYPWLKRVGIRLFNWVVWIVPATYDSFADDVGPEFQEGVSAITIIAIVFSIIMPLIVGNLTVVPWWQIVAYAVGSYLFFGLVYHSHENRWNP